MKLRRRRDVRAARALRESERDRSDEVAELFHEAQLGLWAHDDLAQTRVARELPAHMSLVDERSRDRRRRSLEALAAWKRANPERAAEAKRRWQAENVERTRLYSRAWYWKNREAVLVLRRVRRARRKEAAAHVRIPKPCAGCSVAFVPAAPQQRYCGACGSAQQRYQRSPKGREAARRSYRAGRLREVGASCLYCGQLFLETESASRRFCGQEHLLVWWAKGGGSTANESTVGPAASRMQL